MIEDAMMTLAEPIPLVGRYTRLVPPPVQCLDEFYELAATNRVPWQWGGPETPEAFRESLWNRVLVMFAVQDLRTGRFIGLLKADNANLYHGFAYVTMVMHPDYRMRAWPMEAAALFGNYLFIKFNLLNLYAESPESHVEQFKSGMGRMFEVEGRLSGRVLHNSRREDLYILTFKRERLMTELRSLVDRITQGPRKLQDAGNGR